MMRIEEIPPVFADPVLLRQVLVNLLGNALKYSRERERAEITIGEAAPTEGQRVFFVRDNGAGFDPAHQHRLFQMFERLHDPRAFEGTGIGLAAGRRIIERHGGRMWAESMPDQGATFYFSLPQKPANGQDATSDAPWPSNTRHS
jgi:signal transduction histidine kinase